MVIEHFPSVNTNIDEHSQSLIAQGSQFPLKKPAGFHWDFFLLGITTLISGIFGIPAPNGELDT